MWAQPGASRTQLVGVGEGMLRVRLHAPAREGRANDELIRFAAELFGVQKRDVRLVKGSTGHRKVVHIEGIDLERARAVIAREKGG